MDMHEYMSHVEDMAVLEDYQNGGMYNSRYSYSCYDPDRERRERAAEERRWMEREDAIRRAEADREREEKKRLQERLNYGFHNGINRRYRPMDDDRLTVLDYEKFNKIRYGFFKENGIDTFVYDYR